MDALKRFSPVVVIVAVAACAMPAAAGNTSGPGDTTGRGEAPTRDTPREETPRETPVRGEPDIADTSSDAAPPSDNGGTNTPSTPMEPLECIIKVGPNGKLIVVVTNHTGEQIPAGSNINVVFEPGYAATGVAHNWIRNGGSMTFNPPQDVVPGKCHATIIWQPNSKQQIGQ